MLSYKGRWHMGKETRRGWRSKLFLNRNSKAAVTFAVCVLGLAATSHWHVPDLVKDLTVTITAMAGVHLLERLWLWGEVVNQFSDQAGRIVRDANELVSSASKIGLIQIYSNRAEATADVLEALHGAGERIWILGVAISARIALDAIIDELIRIARKTGNVRIMPVDCLRSPAIFRALLESDEESIRAILFGGNGGVGRLFRQKLYRTARQSAELLRDYPELEPCVKFHAQNPNCWMVVVDDTIFFQPYTLGSSPLPGQSDRCIGPHMPVFRFRLQDRGIPFQILISHLERLWSTSDTDLFHFSAHNEDAERMVQKVLNNRRTWLSHVFGALYHPSQPSAEGDPRAFPRQPPLSFPGAGASPLAVTVGWHDHASDQDCSQRAEVRDFSRNGMSVFLNSSNGPPVDGLVHVSRSSNETSVNLANERKLEALVGTGREFLVRWSKTIDGRLAVGLSAA